MSELFLRPTVIGGDTLANDFEVICEGRSLGRIRQASERIGHNPGWDWGITLPLPVPTWGRGQASDLEGAKTAFKAAWDRFYGQLTPNDIAHWHHIQDAAAERFSP